MGVENTPTGPAKVQAGSKQNVSQVKNKNKNKNLKTQNKQKQKKTQTSLSAPVQKTAGKRALPKTASVTMPKSVQQSVRKRLAPIYANQSPVRKPHSLAEGTKKGTGWNFLRRSEVRNLQVTYLERFIPGSNRALGELRKILGDKSVYKMFCVHTKGKPLVGFSVIEPIEDNYTAALDAGLPMESAAREIAGTSIAEHTPHLNKRQHRSAVQALEEELLEEELLSNVLGAAVFESMMSPCSAPNVGFPDEENRGLSMKLRVRTILVGGPEEDYIISRNPARHIAQDGSGVTVFNGPIIKSRSSTGSNNQWHVVSDPDLPFNFAGTSYLQALGETAFPAVLGMDEDENIGYFSQSKTEPRLPIVRRPYVGPGGSIGTVSGLESAPGDSVTIQAQTTNITAGEYEIFARFYDDATGANVEVATTVTGTGDLISATIVAPAGSSAFMTFGARDLLGNASAFQWPEFRSFFNRAGAPLWIPIGDSSGQDIGLLLDNADDVRTIGCRATATYIGEKLENGYVVAGQPPMPGDAEMPDPTLADLATTLGMKPMALNGSNPGASFPIFPLTKEEMDYHPIQELYDDNDFGEGLIKYKGTTALAEAVILQTEMSIQARTERQTLMVTPGEVSLKAVSDVFTFIAEHNLLDFVTGNDDHEAVAREAQAQYVGEHPTYTFLNGNSVSLSLGL
jgi:hypothetical protein